MSRFLPVLFLILVAYAIAALGFGMAALAGERCGTASWYGEAHHGKTMANGQPFNMNAMTAAMWDVPLGTRYRVTHMQRSVVVTITDRGPARHLNRIIDISKAAAGKLGIIRAGTGRVCLQRLN